ncbi:unnamed protein product [Protopolystoma xenopodis]|uniref:Uncharacterized protein n=1 Tax=Protopolystoma xenopodis TaxID=117903 RepID=A0A448WT73_9PLAT|nr:unnamed protein product [Protopolystoma xenopodis]
MNICIIIDFLKFNRQLNSVAADLDPRLDKFLLRFSLTGPSVGSLDLTGTSGIRLAKLRPPGRCWVGLDVDRPITRASLVSGLADQLTVDLVDKRGLLCPTNTLLASAQVVLTRPIEEFRGTHPVQVTVTCQLKSVRKLFNNYFNSVFHYHR